MTLLAPAARETLGMVVQSDCPTWLEHNFWIEDPRDPYTGEIFQPGPIILKEHQKRILRYAFTRVDGAFPYVTVVYSTIKKSGKTRIAAGIAAWFAATQGNYNEVYCLANDGKQSSDRILSAVKKCVALSPDIDWHVTKTRIDLPNGTFIEAIPCDPTGSAGSNPGLTVWCLDEETEVLTHDGWKTHGTIREDDLIATLNPDSLQFEYQHMQGMYKDMYVGEMLGFSGRSTDMLVTPGHRVLRDNYAIHTAEEMFGNQFTLPTTFTGYVGTLPGRKVKIPGSPMKPPLVVDIELWVRFMAWHLSEGYVRKDGVIIAQSKKRNPEAFKEIVELLEAMGLNPRLEPKGKPHRITIYDSRLRNYLEQFGLSGDKYIPTWIKNLPPDLLRVFLNTYIEGDGHDRGPGYAITTKSKKMADDLQEIALKLGMYASIGSGSFDCYAVYVSKRSSSQMVNRDEWYKKDYEGVVWCPSTSNGIIMVRRNGRACLSGNSEMWGYRQRHQERLWTEMTIPPTRWGDALRLVESYAGYTGESQVLENLYYLGTEDGIRHPAFQDIPVYVNPTARMFCYWDQGNDARRMPWQTPEYYAEEATTLIPSEFRRIHGNFWVDPIQKAIPIEWWDRCQVDQVYENAKMPPLSEHEPVVLAADAAVSKDCCALVGVTRNPFLDKNDPEYRKQVAVRLVRVWEPPPGGKIDLTDTLENAIREACDRYNVIEVDYDKYQLEKMARDMRKEGVAKFYEFSQAGLRSVADQQLHTMVVHRRIIHDGDRVLRNHVNNASAKMTGEKMRFVKPDTSTSLGRTKYPIDALVATSMAGYRCLRLVL